MPSTKYTKITKFQKVMFTNKGTLQVKTRGDKNGFEMLYFVLFNLFRGLFSFPNLIR